MMARLAEICQLSNLPAEFSLESIMGCGLGACWGCVRKIKKGGEKNISEYVRMALFSQQKKFSGLEINNG